MDGVERHRHHDASGALLDQSLSRFADGEPLRIIDLGCGNGRLISLLQGFERTWVGIDPALSGIEMARNLVPDAKFVQTSISEHLLDELDEPPFDVAVSLEVVEHMYDAWDWGQSAFRLLKPGGLLVASTPYHGWAKNCLIAMLGHWDKHHRVHRTGGHIKFFSCATLRNLLSEVGFIDLKFHFSGRAPFLWKNMIVTAHKPR